MKKILIIAATIVVAITANAASYSWGLASFDYTGPDGSGYDADLGGNFWSGGTAFLYLGTVTYDSDNGFITDGTTYVTSSGYDENMFGYGVLDDSDVSALPTNDSVSSAGNQAYSIVLVDKQVSDITDASIENYIIVTGTSSSFYDPATENNYASFVDGTTVIGGDGVAWAPAAEAVPEPTSGLLLLLGMAGLALKRKRA